MDNKELRECFDKIRKNNKDAFTLLYNEYKIPVYTVIYRIVNSKEVAEDITQEVFVKLFVSPPDSFIKKPRAWIFTVARNSAIDYLRKNKDTFIEEAILTTPSVENEVINRLNIEDALQELSITEREIITLHLNAGLTFKEIATITKLSLPATFRRYKKGLQILKEKLSGGVL
ncbi:MAG: sigma-70 family RNA polymerase sigma factor [Ruminococcus sp.]|nr:sigma-70 family RNA polymerase sigma factor [Ruminococcus sp.]